MLLTSKDDVVSSLYEQFKFVEEDNEKFKSICSNNNNAKNILDYKKIAKANVEAHLFNVIQSCDFITMFLKCVSFNGAEFAIHYFNNFNIKHDIKVTFNDMVFIVNNPEINLFLGSLIEKHPEVSFEGDYSFLTNELLKSLLEMFIDRVPNEEEIVSSDSDVLENEEAEEFFDEDPFSSEVNASLIQDEATRYIYMSGGANILDNEAMTEEVLKMKCGDQEAAKKVISSLNKLILSFANYYVRRARTLSVEDLCQEGQIGLIIAVKKFDTTKNVRFTTHAVYWIRQAMQSAIYNQDRTIRIPVYNYSLLNSIKKCRREYINEHFKEPTIKELSELTNIPSDKIEMLCEADDQLTSLDKPVGEDEDVTIADFIDSEDNSFNELLDSSEIDSHKKMIVESLKILNPQELFVITKYFGLDGSEPIKTPAIAEELSLTHQRICQILSIGLRKMKNYCGILIDKPMTGFRAVTCDTSQEAIMLRKQRATYKLNYKTGGRIEIIQFDDIGQYARFRCNDCGFVWQSKVKDVVGQKVPGCPCCVEKYKQRVKDVLKKNDKDDE